MDVHSCLVTFEICVVRSHARPSPYPYHKIVCLSQSVDTIFMEGITCTLEGFYYSHILSLFSLLSSLKRFMYALLYTHLSLLE